MSSSSFNQFKRGYDPYSSFVSVRLVLVLSPSVSLRTVKVLVGACPFNGAQDLWLQYPHPNPTMMTVIIVTQESPWKSVDERALARLYKRPTVFDVRADDRYVPVKQYIYIYIHMYIYIVMIIPKRAERHSEPLQFVLQKATQSMRYICVNDTERRRTSSPAK